MIDRFLALLRAPNSTAPTPDDARLAIAAVLVEAARADGDYAVSEKAQIGRILAARFGLGPWEAEALRAEGEAAQAAATDLVRFTQAIKRAVPHEERIGLIEAVWEIAYADGTRDDAESALVRRLCGLLYVEDREAGLARQRVTARRRG